MSTESLWNQNLLARYAHLPMAEERQQFLQHKLDEGSSWSSLRQLGIYIPAAVSRMQLTSESRPTPKAIDIAAKAWANREGDSIFQRSGRAEDYDRDTKL